MDTPDITKAQWTVFATIVVSLASMAGFDLSQRTDAIVAALVGVYAVAHLLSDAIIRHGRATGLGVARPPLDVPPVVEGDDTVVLPARAPAPTVVAGTSITGKPKR